jgi:serine/threonine-protein kinase
VEALGPWQLASLVDQGDTSSLPAEPWRPPQLASLVDDRAGVAQAPRLAIDQVIGRYRVDEILGVGGMGVVARARDLDLDRDVALKVAVTVSDPARDRRRAELLLREARAMARLRARHVRAVHDVGSAHGIDYIAMEYIAGVDLARWLTTPRPVTAIVAMFVAAAHGLIAAHAAGVLHRDFKPSNVLVGDDGDVVVTDFGLSRWRHEPRPAEPGGTPRYLAPDADPDDPRVDQYSFCVALGEALAQAAPGSLSARVRRRLDRVVRRGSAPAAARFPSMTAVVAALEAATRRPRWPLGLAVVAAAIGVAWLGRAAPPAPAHADVVMAFVNAPVDAEIAQARALAGRAYLRSARWHADAAVALAAPGTAQRRAAAQYERGSAALLDDDIGIARTALEAAAQLADEARDDAVRARALLLLFQLAVSRGSAIHVAERAERAAVAAFARIAPSRAERARLQIFQAVLAMKQGDAAACKRRLTEARAVVTPPALDEILEWAESARSQAAVTALAGDRDAALGLLREAIVTVDRVAGRDHVAALGARGQLAWLLEAAGRDAEAAMVMAELRAAGRTPAGARLLDEVLGPAPATHEVRVAVRDASGAPVAGATVIAATQFHANAIELLGASSLFRERDHGVVIATSQPGGTATLAVADRTRPWIAAEHRALGRAASVRPPDGAPVTLVLSPWATLTGTAPADAALAITPVGQPEAPPIVLRAPHGRFASTRIPEGRYTIAFCVDRPELQRCGARHAAVPEAGDLALTLATGTGELTVSPRDELSRPIESSTVVLAPEGFVPTDLAALWETWPEAVARRPGAIIAWTSVHDTRAARFTGLPLGRYSLCAAAVHGDTDDPSFTARLEARGAPVPLFCTPVTIDGTARHRELVIPAASRIWIGDGPDARLRRYGTLRFR